MDFHKLSPQLVHLLQTDIDPQTPLEVLIQSESTLEEAQIAQLEALDVQLSTVSGKIIGATLPIASVPSVAAFDFIRYIESSTPLYLEMPPPWQDKADTDLNDPPFEKDDWYE